jgi:IS5 family transposase
LDLEHPLYETLRLSDQPLAIAVDSTGISVHRAGGWVERKHGKKKRYVKIHLAVNVESKEIVALEVTTDDTHDSQVFQNLLQQAETHGTVVKVYGDGAYDSSQIYELLESRGVEPVIKPRRNSRLDTPSQARRRVVKMFQHLGCELWSKVQGYGRRWMVETAQLHLQKALRRTLPVNNHEKHNQRTPDKSLPLQHTHKPINRRPER